MSTSDRLAPSARTTGVVLAVSLAAGITGALLGIAWSAMTGVDMGMWVLARASGLVAYLLLTAVTVLGLILARPPRTGARLLAIAQRLRLHVLLAIFALVFIIVHAVVLAIDPWAEVGWAGVLLPFGSTYRPLAVTLGLLATWSALISGATASLAGRGLGRLWLPLHRVAAAGWLLAWLHGVLAGSDTGAWLWMYAVTGVLVLVLAVRRMTAPAPADDLRELTTDRMPREEVLA
ncbi:MAG: hypothetical protein NWR17_02120 [Candidatus Nanopelagicales bacterium]|nr:hypothetical protein [Candidatus Nanopelagicales bacterium]